ncbi:MAG: hypothetical protein PHP01_02280 [Phycisphaerae bacterium]|nr:hypothetical protein [Phycisphaerae bacterium]
MATVARHNLHVMVLSSPTWKPYAFLMIMLMTVVIILAIVGKIYTTWRFWVLESYIIILLKWPSVLVVIVKRNK